jgi:hypothetical protein
VFGDQFAIADLLKRSRGLGASSTLMGQAPC